MATNYIPTSDADFNQWADNFVDSAAKISLSAPLTATLQQLRSQWGTKYATHLNAQEVARGATVGKDNARELYTVALREAAAIVQSNPDVSNESKAAAGLPIRKKGRTPAPVPTTRPTVEVDTAQRLCHIIAFRDEGSTRRSKPAGVFGAEIWVKLGTTPPASTDELRFLGLDTSTPYTAHYDIEDAGKTAYYMLRWVNTRQEPGPWSETVAATIGG